MLDSYLDDFKKLNVDRSSGHAKPHKVCLLYAVIDLIEEGYIQENKIFFDEHLKNKFSEYFTKFRINNDRLNPCLPFYHLMSSRFWHLQPKSAVKLGKKPSVSNRWIEQNIDYAYFDDELFFLLKRKDCRAQLKDALGSNFTSLAEQFERWALECGKSQKTVKSYIGALNSSIPRWAREAGEQVDSLFSFNSLGTYRRMSHNVRQVSEFKKRDTTGKGMYSSALRAYENFLEDSTQVQLQEDIEKIILDGEVSATEKASLVKARLGQGKYRQDLIDLWGSCAITGIRKKDFLVASHIKPWSVSTSSERLDKYNGLLLVANLDRAFDKAYISFDNKGHMLLSAELEEYGRLGIDPSARLNLDKHHESYMAYHREVLFRK